MAAKDMQNESVDSNCNQAELKDEHKHLKSDQKSEQPTPSCHKRITCSFNAWKNENYMNLNTPIHNANSNANLEHVPANTGLTKYDDGEFYSDNAEWKYDFKDQIGLSDQRQTSKAYHKRKSGNTGSSGDQTGKHNYNRKSRKCHYGDYDIDEEYEIANSDKTNL